MKVQKSHIIMRIAAILLAFAVGLAGVEYCVFSIRAELKKQVEQNLLDVAEQNCEQLQTALDMRMKFLESLASQMADEEDPYFLVDQFKPLVDIYNVEWIGYASPEGVSYNTNGRHGNVSGEQFFHTSMRGFSCVSETRTVDGGAGEEVVNIHSVPVYSEDGNRISGVIYVGYRTEVFHEILHIDSFEGRGTSCILEGNGEIIVASSDWLVDGENILDELLEWDVLDTERSEEIRRQIAEEGGVLSSFEDEAGAPYFYYITEVEHQPGYQAWYLATIVPEAVLSERTDPVLKNVRYMLACVMVLLTFCIVIYLLTSRRQRKELYDLAYMDALTGMDNYAAFREKMRSGAGVNGAGYVLSVDLHNFGTINNSCGVAKGDELIRTMGNILANSVEQGELVAHVMGDQFAMFLHCPDKPALIERITEMRRKIIDLSPLLDVPHVVPKFGICEVNTSASPERSYGDANMAKQRLRGISGHFYAIFDEKTRNQTLEIQALEDNFSAALAGHQFEMWYQPKYSPEDGKLVAAEALVRWRKPDGSLIPPGKFIPLFERNGMIAQLDEYTLESVCAQQRAWLDAGVDVVPVSVNVSRVSLYYPNIVARYMVIVKRHGISTENIELEITEGAMESNAEIESVITQFRACGFKILMDDFGSGYSSLAILAKKYFDNIKIDKSLVDCINTPEGDALLKSIVRLAHELHMTVTAEGVEEVSQVNFLIILACDNIQGYYYSRPLPVPDFTKLLPLAE